MNGYEFVSGYSIDEPKSLFDFNGFSHIFPVRSDRVDVRQDFSIQFVIYFLTEQIEILTND